MLGDQSLCFWKCILEASLSTCLQNSSVVCGLGYFEDASHYSAWGQRLIRNKRLLCCIFFPVEPGFLECLSTELSFSARSIPHAVLHCFFLHFSWIWTRGGIVVSLIGIAYLKIVSSKWNSSKASNIIYLHMSLDNYSCNCFSCREIRVSFHGF